MSEQRFYIEYLTYKKFRLNENEYKEVAKLRALVNLKVSEEEKFVFEHM
ncbi:hypothetical protein [Clostridium chromiireducens]|nr:hypothetical protein [Clostridium chromiireducens]